MVEYSSQDVKNFFQSLSGIYISKSNVIKSFHRFLRRNSSMAAQDGSYKVVSPLGRSVVRSFPLSPRLSALEGKRIGFVWNLFANGDVLADALAELLGKRFKRLESIRLPSGKGLRWGNHPDPTLGEVVRESGVDAMIATAGG
jgi:hypothetical protein